MRAIEVSIRYIPGLRPIADIHGGQPRILPTGAFDRSDMWMSCTDLTTNTCLAMTTDDKQEPKPAS